MSSKNFAKRIAIALCATILAFFIFYVRAEFYVATNLTVQGVATLDRTLHASGGT